MATNLRQQALLLLVLITVAITPYAVRAQVSVTTATAGIDPNTQNPTFPAGLNGLSTGSTVQFTALGTAPTPDIARPSNTLTGEALSAFEASIATNFAQASGSDFGYTSTTGNMISGVAATLSGGYNEQAPGQSTASVASPVSSTQAANAGAPQLTASVTFPTIIACISASLGAALIGGGTLLAW